MPPVEVVHQDLPPDQATAAIIRAFINNALGPDGTLISVTFCEGPDHGLQRMIVCYTLD